MDEDSRGDFRIGDAFVGPLTEGDAGKSRQLRDLVTGKEPRGIPRNFVFSPYDGRTYFTGTGVQALGAKWRQLESGLIIPESAAQSPAPIDQITVYLSAEEVFEFSVPPSLLIDNLTRLTAEDVLRISSTILGDLRRPGVNRSEVDKKYADMWFNSPVKDRVLNLLRQPNRGLIVPQAIYSLIAYSMRASGDSLLPHVVPGNFVVALIAAQEMFGSRLEAAESGNTIVSKSPGALGREIISNQIFNSSIDEVNLMGRFARVWLELPSELKGSPEITDMEQGYAEIVGVPLRDVLAVGLVLFSISVNGDSIVTREYLSSLAWDSDRLDKALAVFSAELPEFRGAILDERRNAKTDWTFGTFGRYPVVRLWHGGLIILDLALLLPRVFGWLPIFDVEFAARYKGAAAKKKAASLKQSLRRLSEKYCAEVLDSMTASTSAMQRVYHDEHLKAAYGGVQGVKVADAAIDYGDSWVVIEVTTSQLKRESVYGVSDESVVEDLLKLVGEVEQIDSSISEIRRSEQQLTGFGAPVKRTFYPLLVTTEGFPVNPISLTLLREHVAEAGLLQGEDVAPLEVVDVIELEIVEGLQEEGGPNLPQLLERKRGAGLERASLRDFILMELRLNPRRPSRLDRIWHQLVDNLARRIFGDEAVNQHQS
ncbi:hypothetical protein ACWED2_26620 [Amycolatopsis sp. NPDC005003]